MPSSDLPAAFACIICGDRMEFPDQTLRDLHRVARSEGYHGGLIEDGTALAAICPKCNSGPCPQCGQPVNGHELRDGRITNCGAT